MTHAASSDQPDELEDRLCMALYQAAHAMTAVYRQVLLPLDLTYPQYIVLSALWRTDPLMIKDLAGVLDSDYNTMSPLIKRLETKGLVRRSRSRSDEREVAVHLTPSGRRLQGAADHVQRDVVRAAGMSEQDRSRLVRRLHRLTDRLSAHQALDSRTTSR